MRSNPKAQISRPTGFALVAVLWLIAILALASVTTLRVISFDMQLATAKVHGSRACHLAEMGIAIGSNAIIQRDDPLLHRIDEANNEEYHVSLHSEGARFNINSLVLSEDKTLLRSIFIHWGLDLDSAQALTDAFTDWVDGDDEVALNGAEIKEYEKLGRINQPFNRPFYDVAEMSLVLGMDQAAALRPDWKNWFTVFSSGTLDINEADAELIAIAAEVSPEQAAIIPETVRGTDDILDTEDDARFEDINSALTLLGIGGEVGQRIAPRFTTQDDTTRISSLGRSGDAKRRINVIVRNRTGRPLLLERNIEIVP
jgi:general secretion pathway protein K